MFCSIDCIALFALPTPVSMFSFTSLFNLFQIPHPYRFNNSPITWYRPVPFFNYVVLSARSIVSLFTLSYIDLVSSCCIVQFYCMVALLCPPAWLHCSVLLYSYTVQSSCMVTVQSYFMVTVQSYCIVTLFSSTT